MARGFHNASGDRFARNFRKRLLAALCLVFALTALVALSGTAQAASRCTVDPLQNPAQFEKIKTSAQDLFREPINKHVTKHFVDHRTWMLDDIWLEAVLPALQSMTEQLSATAIYQVSIIGTFFDAKHQLETNRLFQTLAAEAQKDFTPSEGVCTIGTSIRSLAQTEQAAEKTAHYLSRHFLNRHAQYANNNAAEGWRIDHQGRMARFLRLYCDPSDNNNELQSFCTNAPQAADSPDLIRRNKDVDFSRTLGVPDTLNIDFSDDTLSADEEDLLALSAYLYSHNIMEPIAAYELQEFDHPRGLKKRAFRDYLTRRSLIAQRSVAVQPYIALAAMKTKGENTPQSTSFLRALLTDTGIPSNEAAELVGANPSYYAQMGLMTKTLFQRPEFYVGLYDRPANLERKKVALQAVSLMQKRDLFQSALRSEAIISLWLELELTQPQLLVQNELNPLTPNAR